MRALVVGAVESTRVALQRLAAADDWSVAAVLTLPRDLAHRHSDFVDLEPDAVSSGAPVLTTSDCNTPDIINQLKQIDFDYAFVIGWSQICGSAFRAAAGGRVIGYHPAPLPRLRGRAVIPWSILLDEKITASSLFWIDDGVDSGPIIGQRYFHIAPDETAGTLYARHLEALADLLDESLPLLASGAEPRSPQDDRFATWAAKRGQADGLIDWTRPARDVLRLIRAVGRPYPGAFTFRSKHRLTVWSAQLWPNARLHHGDPGQVVATGADGIAVLCGDGEALCLTECEGVEASALRLHSRLGGPS